MKKVLCFLLAILFFAFSLFSCGATRPSIEDYQWKMRTAIRLDGDSFTVSAVEAEDSAHPEAKIIDMILIAQDGKITVTDLTNDKSYNGSYSLKNKTPDGADYEIIIDSLTGYGTVAMTEYADGSEEPTLPITLGDFSIYFYAEK